MDDWTLPRDVQLYLVMQTDWLGMHTDRLPIYVRHPQMLPDENNLDTAALAKRSIRHKYALENVQANAVNQTRGIF